MNGEIFRRINDPINYKEACFYIAYKQQGLNQREYILSLNDADRVITWLGSNCGESLLRRANELIEEYPYKDVCNAVIICGEIQDNNAHIKHWEWINNKLDKK